MPKSTPIVRFVVSALTSTAFVFASVAALAQSEGKTGGDGSAINLETPSVLPNHSLGGRLDVRAFGDAEGITYTTLGLRLGLNQGWEVGLRGVFADTTSRSLTGGGGAIRHGGSDIEALAKYKFPKSGRADIATYAGIALPNTPARKSSALTLGLTGEMPLGKNAYFTLNPRTVFLSGNTIIGFGLGLNVEIFPHLSFVGDYTPILSGDNTRNTTNGARSSHDVYGAALRYRSKEGRFQIDLGYTNAPGFTTGASLTPGLDGSGAFYLSISARR